MLRHLGLMRAVANYIPIISLLGFANSRYENLIFYYSQHRDTTAFASPANVHYVVHERRDAEISDWMPKAIEVDRSTILPLSIALTQRNLEKGQDSLIDVSDPFSPNYGKHWSAQKVISTITKVSPANCRRSLRLLSHRIRQLRRSNHGLSRAT